MYVPGFIPSSTSQPTTSLYSSHTRLGCVLLQGTELNSIMSANRKMGFGKNPDFPVDHIDDVKYYQYCILRMKFDISICI